MAWWAWLALGALLLVAELSFLDLEFYLVFLGVSAMAVGLLELGGVALPYWGQWLAFGALSVVSLVWFRQRVFSRLRPPPEGEIPEGVEGERAVAREAIPPGAIGTVMLRGTRWSALNEGRRTIPTGGACEVEAADGTVLSVIPGD